MTELDIFTKQIEQIAKDLSGLSKEKTDVSRISLMQKIEAAAAGVAWPDFIKCLASEIADTKQRVSSLIEGRREKLHTTARERGIFSRRVGGEDQVGLLRLHYSGPQVSLRFAGEELEKSKEADGGALLDLVGELERKLSAHPFERGEFFRELKNVLTGIAAREHGRSGGVPVSAVHHEIVIEKARRLERFRKNPSPKNLPDYPLYQFLFDLARFADGGWKEGDSSIRARIPSMAESAHSFSLPCISNPEAPETPVYVLQFAEAKE